MVEDQRSPEPTASSQPPDAPTRPGEGDPLEEMLGEIPEPFRGQLQAAFFASQTMGQPLLDKVQPEHITTVLELRRLQMEQEHQHAREERKYALIYFAIVTIVVLVVLLIFGVFKENPTVLTGVLSAILGSSGGYGIGYFRGRRAARAEE